MKCRHMEAAFRRIPYKFLKHRWQHECKEASDTGHIKTLLIAQQRFLLSLIPKCLPAVCNSNKGSPLSCQLHMTDSFIPDKQGIAQFFLQCADPAAESRLCDI